MRKGEVKKSSRDALQMRLKKAGYKMTLPRLSVLEIFENAKYPLSVKDIIKEMGTNAADQVTVYRIVTTFKEKGLVRQVDLQKGHGYFELNNPNDEHHHVVCVSCNKIEDFHESACETLAQEALKHTPGFARLTDHSFELFGVCNRCDKKVPAHV